MDQIKEIVESFKDCEDYLHLLSFKKIEQVEKIIKDITVFSNNKKLIYFVFKRILNIKCSYSILRCIFRIN